MLPTPILALFTLFAPDDGHGEEGFSTAELLGNAALGIAALVAIWVLMDDLGLAVVQWIRGQLGLPPIA